MFAPRWLAQAAVTSEQYTRDALFDRTHGDSSGSIKVKANPYPQYPTLLRQGVVVV